MPKLILSGTPIRYTTLGIDAHLSFAHTSNGIVHRALTLRLVHAHQGSLLFFIVLIRSATASACCAGRSGALRLVVRDGLVLVCF